MKTRVLMAIPRNKIKPKRVPKAQLHLQGGAKSKQKPRLEEQADSSQAGQQTAQASAGVKVTVTSTKAAAAAKKRVPIEIQQQEFVYPAALRGQATTHVTSHGTTPSSTIEAPIPVEKQLNRLSVSAAKPIQLAERDPSKAKLAAQAAAARDAEDSKPRVVVAKTIDFLNDLPPAAATAQATRYQEMTFQNGFPMQTRSNQQRQSESPEKENPAGDQEQQEQPIVVTHPFYNMQRTGS